VAGPERRPGRWRLLALLAAACLAPALSAAAEDEPPKRVQVELTVTHAGPEPGVVEPSQEWLTRSFRYQSARVIQSRSFDLEVDEVGSLELPNGRWMRVRPLDVSDRGALIAVDIQDTLKTDVRVGNRKKVVIGAPQPFKDGKLIIEMESRY